MAVSKRLRYEILRRDNHACRYCGASAPDAPLRIDHVTPVALGGTDAPENLVTSCEPCNSGKTSTTPDAPLVADVSNDALRWASAMKQASEALAADHQAKDSYRSAFQAAWESMLRHTPLPSGWKQSIETFRLAGLPASVWPDNVETAASRPQVRADAKFRYVCGIAWKQVSALQDSARAMLADAPEKMSAESTAEDEHESVECLVEYLASEWWDAWIRGNRSRPSNDDDVEFRKSTFEFLATEPGRIDHVFAAAVQAGYFGATEIASFFPSLEYTDPERVHENAMRWWHAAWVKRAGEPPAKADMDVVCRSIDAAVEARYEPSVIVEMTYMAGAFQDVDLGRYLTTIPEVLAAD